MRINQYLAACGVASRRGSEALVVAGRVTVNGEIATLGTRVEPGDEVIFDGAVIAPQGYAYYLYHKPVGVICSMSDPQGRDCVGDVLRRMEVPEAVVPVGRLDGDSQGLLLLTNDGEMTNAILHPSHGVGKTYRVQIRGFLTPEQRRDLARGVELEEGMTAPATVRHLGAWSGGDVLAITLREGKNRQVRRMVAAVGGEVYHLQRVAIGTLTDENLVPGGIRKVTAVELAELRRGIGMDG